MIRISRFFPLGGVGVRAWDGGSHPLSIQFEWNCTSGLKKKPHFKILLKLNSCVLKLIPDGVIQHYVLFFFYTHACLMSISPDSDPSVFFPPPLLFFQDAS